SVRDIHWSWSTRVPAQAPRRLPDFRSFSSCSRASLCIPVDGTSRSDRVHEWRSESWQFSPVLKNGGFAFERIRSTRYSACAASVFPAVFHGVLVNAHTGELIAISISRAKIAK